MKHRYRAVVHGVMAGLILTLVYFAIVGYLESVNHAIEEFLSISYLMIPLIVGFGVQIALYSYSRQYLSAVGHGSASVSASGGLSTGGMIACCAHHITDVAPALGITAVASALVSYQPVFVTIGLLSNAIGILTILAMIQKHHFYNSNRTLAKIMRLNIRRARNYVAILSLIIILVLTWTSWIGQENASPPNITEAEKVFRLPAKTIEQKGLVISVVPLPFFLSQEIKFKIDFDTHAGSLEFDVVKATFLQDDFGNTYKPSAWDGSPAGGHHREGNLSFPPLSGEPNSIRLIMKDVYGADWVFEWTLTD